MLQSSFGRTPLHMATIYGRYSRAETIIERGKFLLFASTTTQSKLLLLLSIPYVPS